MTEKAFKHPKIRIEKIGIDFLNPDNGINLKVLENIDFDVWEGGVYSIVGPSGCGKTTLLKIIAGLITPVNGKVLFNGSLVKKSSEERIMVFQDLHLFNWMTVYQNIEFSFSVRNIKGEEPKREIQNLIRLAGLKGFENYYPHEISGGMRQRLGLARALAAQPSVLLLDEPFSSLDMGTKTELEVEFLNLIKIKKITTILVTHDVRQAVYLGDKVIVLSARPGKIREIVDIPFSGERNEKLWERDEFHKLEVYLSKMLKEKI